MGFEPLAGNRRLKSEAAGLLAGDRFPHAVLIEGEPGLGKRTFARLLACALVCKAEQRPCLVCPACKKVLSGGHPDVMEASGGQAARSFHIEVIRQVRSDVFVLPNEADKKVYILGNAHTMSEQAQNALLKILEEPPDYAVFLLTCLSRTAMLPTVVSRSVSLRMEAVEEEEARAYVTKALPEVPPEEVGNAAVLWNGNIGRMLEGLQKGHLSEAVETARAVCRSLADSEEMALLACTGRFEKDREMLQSVLNLLKMIVRDAVVYSCGGQGMLSGQAESVRLLSGTFPRERLAALLETLEECEAMQLRNCNHTLLMTRFCYGLRRASGR